MIMPILILGILGLAFAIFLTYFNLKMKVEENPLVARIYELMPKGNCGACGLAGCSSFAEQVAEGKVSPEKCTMITAENFSGICEILGVEKKDREKMVARVSCFGGDNSRKKFQYGTLRSCSGLGAIFGTNLECAYGCIGMGDCVEACPVGALKMGENGVPVVDDKSCTGCGICVKACPKNIIRLLPEECKVNVACLSRERGPAVIKVCKSGCIGCGKCVKSCEKEAISIQDNLAVIDYAKCDGCGTCVENCPRKIIFISGIKSEHLA